VASAIGQIGNDSEQAQAAVALFGRSGAELIPMFEEVAKGAEDVSLVMSQEVISNLDAAGDAMNYVTQAGKVLIGMIVAVGVETYRMMVEPFTLARQVTMGLGDDIAALANELPKVPDITGKLIPPGLGSVAVDDFNKASKALDDQRRAAEAAEKQILRLAAEQKKAREASIVMGTGIEYASQWVQRLDAEILRLNASGGKKITDIFEFDRQPVDNATAALLKFQGSISYFSSQGSKAWSTFAQTVQRDTERFKPSFEGLATAFQNLGPAVVGAVQGGGSVTKTIGSMLGQGLGADLGQQFGAVIGKSLGPTLGKALGSLGGPLGAIVGQLGGELAGKLFGKLFGPSQQKLASDMRDKFLAAGGGIDAVRDRANAAGVSMDKLFSAQKPKDMEAAINAFNKELEAAEEAAEKAKEELAKMNTEMGTLLKEADTLGLVLPESLQLSIDKLIESGQLTEENKKLLEGLGRGSQSEFKAMEEAAKKYGVELTALGPAFNQNKVNETASDIIGSFDTMIKGGADLNGVIAGMSDEINKFLENAMKTGSTVPENMRPILEAMIQQGKLTDANGKKLTDLGGIKFGAPVETAVDKLIAKITELVDKITDGFTSSFKTAAQQADNFSRKATDAVNRVPREIDFRYRGYPDTEPPGFDRGGVVGRDYRPPSSRDIIPALLRPGEVVLTPEQARMGGARGPAVNVVINVAGYLDSPTARSGLADIVRDELSKNLRRVGRAA
jgi:prefoldin subunit 5